MLVLLCSLEQSQSWPKQGLIIKVSEYIAVTFEKIIKMKSPVKLLVFLHFLALIRSFQAEVKVCTEYAVILCKYFDEKEEIDCSERSLTCIPIFDLALIPLSTLNFRDNQIRTLGSSIFKIQFKNVLHYWLAKVKELDISVNQLELIEPNAFDGLPELKTLWLNHNRLTVLKSNQFSHLGQLNTLTLNDNQITKMEPLALEGLTSLISVNLENNPLKIPETCIPCIPRWKGRLRGLAWDLSSALGSTTILPPNVFKNQARTSGVEHIFIILALDLSNNHLTRIYPGAFNGMNGLKKLNLNHNKLTSISNAGVSTDFFKIVSIQNNPIKKLESGDFSTYSLEEIDLSDCAIETIHPNAFRSSNTKKISLSGNKITTIKSEYFSHVPDLETLLLDNNQIQTLEPDTFKSLWNLKTVNMSNNPVQVTQENCLPCFPVWKDIGIFSDDKITWDLRSSGIPGTILVKNLFQHQLRFREDSWFYDISKVETLDLTLNGIREIHPEAFSGFKTLTNLKLGENSLTKVPGQSFSDIIQLKILSLNGNSLKNIGPNEFLALANLIDLDLSECELWTIDANAFEGLTSLNNLDLSKNQLTRLTLKPETFFPLKELKLLRLDGNNITKADLEELEELKFLQSNSSHFNEMKMNTTTEPSTTTTTTTTTTVRVFTNNTVVTEKLNNTNIVNTNTKVNSSILVNVLCNCDEPRHICTGLWAKTSEGLLECQIQPHRSNLTNNNNVNTNTLKSGGNGVNFEEFVFPGLVLLVLVLLVYQIIPNFKRLLTKTTPALISVTWKPNTQAA